MEEDPIKIGRKFFVGKTEVVLKEKYEFLGQIGKGYFGKIYSVKVIKTGEMRACKQLSKLGIVDHKKLQREIDILMKADHPNIIKLYEYIETDSYYYLMMEECKGGQLFNKIIEHVDNHKMYTEKEAAEIIKEIMSAIEYCHNNGICHRDLKPENLLYLKKGDEKDNPIKIIDFGLGQNIDIKKILSSKVGSLYYVSPEVLAGKYNEKCDIWSVGVILYMLLSGCAPFNGPSKGVIYSKIKAMKFSFPDKKWSNISSEAKDLINHMLVPEAERYTAKQVLAHPWFKIVQEKKLEQLNFSSKFFKDYNQMNKLQKAVLLFIASKLSENEIQNLKEIFKAFDQDNDGQISFNEFEEGLKKINNNEINEKEINECFSSIDTDKNGKIDYTEFIAASLEKQIFLKEQKLFEAFSAFDKDHNGKITKEDLMSVLRLEPKDDNFAQKLIENADKNEEGFIDYKGFLEFMGLKK